MAEVEIRDKYPAALNTYWNAVRKPDATVEEMNGDYEKPAAGFISMIAGQRLVKQAGVDGEEDEYYIEIACVLSDGNAPVNPLTRETRPSAADLDDHAVGGEQTVAASQDSASQPPEDIDEDDVLWEVLDSVPQPLAQSEEEVEAVWLPEPIVHRYANAALLTFYQTRRPRSKNQWMTKELDFRIFDHP